MSDHRLPETGHVGRAGEYGKTWARGKGEITDGLRGSGSSNVWHHGGLEHRRASPLRIGWLMAGDIPNPP